MRIDVLTLCTDGLAAYLGETIVKRAQDQGVVAISVHNIREYARDKNKTVDDVPYGGGPGMVMKPEPIFDALDRNQLWQARKILLSPRGAVFNQEHAQRLASLGHLVLLCGHYEGVDQRVCDAMDEEVCIGDYVLSNGAVAAMAVIDAVTRLLPGALGNDESAVHESFSDGLLEYPQYTRPPAYRGADVPAVLLSGDHGCIARWRRRQALLLTKARRPDLFARLVLSADDAKLINLPEDQAVFGRRRTR
ncbi:tRNA (guanosine(37)-N1)-methyltransferase TrmD [bacterium]|nr:tRNA (guanosine(37)-N1)-methyltransferase TrmD [bacterium]